MSGNKNKVSNITKTQRAEMKIYEFLGVTLFRRVILAFERIKHHCDNKKNINYHLKDHSLVSMQSFSGYLLYNSFWHIVSLLFAVVFLVEASFAGFRFLLSDLAMIVVTIINIYCIMLQRYIYLRLRVLTAKHIEKRKIKEKNGIRAVIKNLESGTPDEPQEEYALVCRIFLHVQNGTDCYLSKADSSVLERIYSRNRRFFDDNVRERACLSKNGRVADVQSILNQRRDLYVVNTVEGIAAHFQKLCRLEKRNNLLFGFSIITEDRECEMAFTKLFSVISRDHLELALSVLQNSYLNYFNTKIKGERSNAFSVKRHNI